MQTVTIPIGPGKGQDKPLPEALLALAAALRGHVRDLRDLGQPEQAELLEQYLIALELINWQLPDYAVYGARLPNDLIQQANKYHLAISK